MKNSKAAMLLVLMSLAGFVNAGEIAVVVGSSSPAASMSAEQVSQIFLGKSNSMTPVDQNESSSAKADFYKKAASKDLAQVKSIWSKVIFTGKGTPPKEVGGNAEVKKAVAADPKTIGYIDKSAVDGTVKVLLTLQ